MLTHAPASGAALTGAAGRFAARLKSGFRRRQPRNAQLSMTKRLDFQAGDGRHRSRAQPATLAFAWRAAAVVTAVAVFCAQTAPASARGLIRDAETEALIADYSRPIFAVAGLSRQNVKIHLVADSSFNAFVIDGQNMIIHTGAILRSKTPNQLIGVIAHETGHIAGGHLSRLRAYIAKAQTAALMLNLLGIAAIAVGASQGGNQNGGIAEGGVGALQAGNSLMMHSVLAYRRAEESAADQAGISYLTKTKQSGRGMLQTFQEFADQSLASLATTDPYVQSHPMPQDRIAQLRELARASPYFDRRDPPALQRRHDMVRAKLLAFLNRTNARMIFRKYPESDRSLPAQYARAIGHYYAGGMSSAAPYIDALISAEPNNPYFYELKGQFLLESGKSAAAIAPLQRAVNLAPKAGLIRIMLGQALLDAGGDKRLKAAVEHLKKALVRENQSILGHQQLALAYGRMNRLPEAALASAQAYFYEGRVKEAKIMARRAQRGFPQGSAQWVKADDIVSFKPPKK
jgi:predicted Zn-dependent protease